MAVLQFSGDTPTESSTDQQQQQTELSASPTKEERIPSPRKTPSPVKSISSNISSTSLSAGYGTTPVTSNLAFYHSRAAAAAANNVGQQSHANVGYNNLVLGNSNMMQLQYQQQQQQQQQQSFAAANGMHQQQPMSFMQMSNMQQQQQQPVYMANNTLPQNELNSAHHMHINQQRRELLPPLNNTSMNNNMSPLLPRRGQRNNGMINSGMNNPQPPPWNMLNAHNQHMMMGANSVMNNPTKSNLLGPVTVGGTAGSRVGGIGPINNLQRRIPIPQPSANPQSGDLNNYAQVAANRNRMVNNNGMLVNNTDGMSVFGNGSRNRVIGSSSRPPLPMASPGTAAPNDQQQQQQQQYHQLDLQRSPTPLRNNSVATNPNNTIEYQHPDIGLDGDFVGGVIEDATAYNLSTCTPEIGLSTGLVTLSVHEALTFDGVELALHPDVFKGSKKKGGKDDGVIDNQSLRPGDLVEIRVWVARPGMAAENSTSPQSKGGGSSTIQSRMNPGLARPSLHNRDTSLHTVGSSLTNTSLMNTPRSMLGVKQFALGQAPPLPRVIGGTTPPIGHSPSTSMTSVDRLFGENLVASASESVDGWSGVLHGEHLLETPKPNQHQISPGAASNLSLSSVISGAASSLFRKVAAPSHSSHTSEDSPSVLGHSRSGSDVSALHSRDSSLIGNGGSWTNALNTSSNSKDSPPQISPGLDSSPSSALLQSVAEGLPQQPHPLLVTNLSQHSMTSPESSQILPMRRGSNSSQTQSLGAPPPPPLHPLSAAASESSTPTSSQPPSPKKERSIFTPPTSSSKPTPPSTTSKPTPPSTASKSLGKKPPISHRPLMSHSMDSSTSQEQVNAPLGNTSLPSSILSPDITSIVAAGNETNRRRTSSSDGPPRPDLPIRIGEVSSSSHNRNNTISGGLVTSGSSHLNVLPPHRRYRSGNNIPAISHVDSMMSVAGSSIMNNSIEPTIDINESLQRTHFVRISFVMPVSEGSLTSIKSSARTRVSLLRRVAELYNITAYDTVTVTQVTRSNEPLVHQSISADFLTITFKDQFVSRGDMYTFQKSFLNSWVYEGKRLSFNGMRTNTKVIRHGDHVVRSGLITEDTKLTFRSRSARIIWLVQISSEMWEQACPYEAVGHQTSHESSCKIYYDKFIEFVRRLFDKWKKLQLTHNLTVVFFSRTYIRHPDIAEERRSSSFVHVDSDGRLYEDHYRIVLENETTADDKLIHKLKKEFVSYPKGVKWNLSLGNERTPSTASQGNVLEAINITLNLLQLHYIDRDLHRTGNSIVIITPGNGVFEIEKNLAGITKQRMMDNGIGSDMVSLGLPPLHVAPFFLYKEREAAAAEETQGYKVEGVDQTYFELPHWMNLSFVDYDEEEEGPMLYKENDDDDNFLDTTNSNNNDDDGEDEPHVQTWSASNGFLKRNNNSSVIQETNQQPMPIGSARQQRYKNLIRDRGFEDILQACRPRSRGEYGSGLPVSLTNLLKKVARPVTITRSETDDNLKMANLNRDSQQLASLGDMARSSPQRALDILDTSKSRYVEWGTVNFDAFPQRRFSNAQHQPYNTLNRSFSGSHGSSPSSSLGSYRFPSHLLSISHLQSTASLGSDGQSVSSGHQSNGSMATPDNEQDAPSGIDELKKFMSDYDTSTFSNTPTGVHAKSGNVSQSILEDSLRNSPNELLCPGSPRGSPVKGLLRSQSALLFPAFNKNKGSGVGGGIEAALNQFDGTSRQRKDGVTSPRGDFLEYKISEDALGGSSSLAVSPLSSSIGMHFSLDRRNDGLRPSAMRLVAPVPEAMPSERFLPLDITQRRSSFQLSQKPKMPTRDHSYNQLKSSGQISSKEGRLKEGHTSSANKESTKKALPLKRGTSKGNKKHRQRTPGRHRRKPWVLNPFRQEDEDEVLAKRTHNRRRWSHVFPLGEDEFKRHAGPNWKSLCQPAILPLTIDYYPTPQDLRDEKKFSVKQYSVTLPPLEERTSYKSHKELLDDLLIQRMRQDFQIVPRAIIQNASRDTATADNMLEATLSMGHKIQKLLYNPSSDSVDVIQYYARFAEDETPQTYRYMLWSALKQDYVSVFQPFTKYTRPYKWNELDMLISGDAVTTILEGMRYPRISFVIMPDKFVDAEGEKEYVEKFQRLVEYFGKVQEAREDSNGSFNIEIHLSNDDYPQASSGAERFVVDLTKDKKKDKYEWMELAHDSNCDTRRTFRMTIQWLVAVASKIDQQAQRLSSRCKREGLTLISVPHFSCLRSCFLNPFAVPITKPIRDKNCVDLVEKALTKDFDFVYDGTHMSDPNEIDSLDGFDFAINKWSIKKRKKFVPARQYLHRSGVLFMRILRDARGCAIIITYLNSRHIAGDEEQLQSARIIYYNVDQYIMEVCKRAGFKSE